jgi:GT2 family glycosyltransferase
VVEVKKKFPKVKVVELPQNIGLSAGFNRGVKEAHGEIIFGIDNDGVVEDNKLLSRIAEKFNNPRLNLLACIVKDYHTRQERPNVPARLASGNPNDGYDCLQFDGCGFAIRKSLFERVGGFPEDYFIYCGEMNLAIKCIDAGSSCKFFPDLVVYHAQSDKSRSRLGDYYAVRNLLWWYWEFFPLYDLAKRGFGFGPVAKKLVSGIPLSYNPLRGIVDALIALPRIIKRRKPLSKETMQHFYRVVEEQKSASRH